MDVKLPDGTVVKNVPDGTTKAQLAQKLQMNGHHVPSEWLTPSPPPVEGGGDMMDTLKDFGSAAARPAARAVAALPLMAADAGVGVGNFAMQNLAGRSPQDNLELPSSTFEKALNSVTRPPTGKWGQMAEDVSSSLFGAKFMPGPKAPPGAAPAMTAGKAVDPMVKKASDLGYVLKPSEAGGKVGKVVEGLAGSPKLSVEGSVKNQVTTNRLGAEEIGLSPGTKLSKASLEKAKKPHNAVYKEMGKLGEITTDPKYQAEIQGIGRTPGTSFAKDVNKDIENLKEAYAEPRFESRDAVLKVRELRARAVKNIKAQGAPEKNELGYAQRKVADAIESQMERHAQSVGQGDLVARFKAARVSLAKIHTVESALVGNTGDLSAQGLAKQLNRGAPLSGKLKDIADVANEFQEVTRDATKLRNKTPVSVLEGVAGGAGAAATALHNPAIGLPIMGGMVARPLARKALLSKPYQNRLGGQGKPKLDPAKTKEAIRKVLMSLGVQQGTGMNNP